jgi:hypothetical protein
VPDPWPKPQGSGELIAPGTVVRCETKPQSAFAADANSRLHAEPGASVGIALVAGVDLERRSSAVGTANVFDGPWATALAPPQSFSIATSGRATGPIVAIGLRTFNFQLHIALCKDSGCSPGPSDGTRNR